MSEENVALVRQAYEAFNRGDIEGAVADLAPDFDYLPTGTIPGMEWVAQGREGFRQFLESWWGEFDEPRVDTHELIDADDQVVASLTFRGRGKQSGAATSWDLWQTWTMRNGKAVRGRGYTSREDALEAVGLPE